MFKYISSQSCKSVVPRSGPLTRTPLHHLVLFGGKLVCEAVGELGGDGDDGGVDVAVRDGGEGGRVGDAHVGLRARASLSRKSTARKRERERERERVV